MPGTPAKKKQLFSAFVEITGKISEALGVDGVKTATESLSAYTQLESLMKQINLDSTRSLREKKNAFLQQAPDHISKLTTTDLIKLYNVYKNDFNQEQKYAFIYTEDTQKTIGWIKLSIFGTNTPVGNTNTHKNFLALLKKRALANIERHHQDDAQRSFHDNREELNNLRELMSDNRGRIPNPFSDLGGGLEGKFKSWHGS
ncbi:MAG: hypothetical protein Q8L78_01735 [Coxiellaceae bacterium]|nr:hypothetical protein [Coxiellaceae bacterium]